MRQRLKVGLTLEGPFAEARWREPTSGERRKIEEEKAPRTGMGMLGGLARASSCYCSTSSAGCSLASLRSLRLTLTATSSIAAIASDAPRRKCETLSNVHSQQHHQQHQHHSRRLVSSFFVSCPPSVLGRSDRRAIMTGGGVVKAVLTSEVGLTKPAAPVVPEIAVHSSDADAVKWKGDILVVGVFEGCLEDKKLKSLDELVGGLISDIIKEEDFSGKIGQSTYTRLAGHTFKRVGLVGLGKVDAVSKSTKVWKTLGENIATASKTAQATSVAVFIAGSSNFSEDVKLAAASAITSGVILGTHEDTRFKSESKKPLLRSVDLLGLGNIAQLEDQLAQTVHQCGGVILAKQLVNAPPNVLIPSVLADEAENIAAAHGDVMTAKILDKKECEELKMGAYLGVAAASTNPPKFIHLCYTPPSGTVTTKLAIVGKGLTFDSGGYNLKTGPGSMIELMKFDMGGAAAVLGAAKAIAAIKPLGVQVNFIVAACENMISGGGMRPGDILTASNGKTIEVNNTDAEGRLTLADALIYAGNLKVDKIVDLATLTGACIVALGNEIGGMFTPSDVLAEELTAASKKGGEKFWRMPMEDGYWDMMKSNIADMVNTGGRAGGSITAALFLKQFVDEDMPWAHLDMAGPVWKEKSGATGFAVSTLVEWVTKHKSS